MLDVANPIMGQTKQSINLYSYLNAYKPIDGLPPFTA